MKQVAVREAQINLSKLLQEPFEITRYGKVIAIVTPVNGKTLVGEFAPNLGHPDNPFPLKETRHGFCETHFERGAEYELKLVSYSDPNGIESEPKWICPKCIKRMESEVKRNGGRIVYKTANQE